MMKVVAQYSLNYKTIFTISEMQIYNFILHKFKSLIIHFYIQEYRKLFLYLLSVLNQDTMSSKFQNK